MSETKLELVPPDRHGEYREEWKKRGMAGARQLEGMINSVLGNPKRAMTFADHEDELFAHNDTLFVLTNFQQSDGGAIRVPIQIGQGDFGPSAFSKEPFCNLPFDVVCVQENRQYTDNFLTSEVRFLVKSGTKREAVSQENLKEDDMVAVDSYDLLIKVRNLIVEKMTSKSVNVFSDLINGIPDDWRVVIPYFNSFKDRFEEIDNRVGAFKGIKTLEECLGDDDLMFYQAYSALEALVRGVKSEFNIRDQRHPKELPPLAQELIVLKKTFNLETKRFKD